MTAADTAPLSYRVVVNDEEQFSVWPSGNPLPAGWRDEGTSGTRDECLAHVDRVWTDMRPLSLRRLHAEERTSGEPVENGGAASPLKAALVRDIAPLLTELGLVVSATSSARPEYDVRLDVCDGAGDASARLAERLGELAFVEVAVVDGTRVFVRVVESYLREAVVPAVLNAGSTFGHSRDGADESVMVIYSNPNANKPLHIGHLRDNFVGTSVARLLESDGHTVFRGSLASDWGVHIAKAVLAYQKWGNGATPDQAGQKGDHFVGGFYIKFSRANADLPKDNNGETELEREAQELLREMERTDGEARRLNDLLTGWVRAAHDETYRRIGTDLHREVSEHDALAKARQLIAEQVARGTCRVREDGSVSLDLVDKGLWDITVLRGDGTATVYAQHLGGKLELFDEFRFDRAVLVYGRDWDMPYLASSGIYSSFGISWASFFEGVGHGVVGLPEGRMRSRAGTVVNADPLLDKLTDALLDAWGGGGDERRQVCDRLAVATMKHYLLSVKRSKDIAFTEAALWERTVPRLARALHALAAAEAAVLSSPGGPVAPLTEDERGLIRRVNRFPAMRRYAVDQREPAVVVRYLDDLATLAERCAGPWDATVASVVAVVLRECFELLDVELPTPLADLPPQFAVPARKRRDHSGRQSRTRSSPGNRSATTAAV